MNKLIKAFRFAAEKHSLQRRKNISATPYINHAIEVAEYISTVGGITDENVLIAAVLHDSIEDTNTSREEIASHFGNDVLSLVLECSDDKSFDYHERKKLQITNASSKSKNAKMISIADKVCNVQSIINDPPANWSLNRRLAYVKWAIEVMDGLFGHNPTMDTHAKEILEMCMKTLTNEIENDSK